MYKLLASRQFSLKDDDDDDDECEANVFITCSLLFFSYFFLKEKEEKIRSFCDSINL